MDTPITHAEQTQFEKAIDAELKRLADEDSRQNKRIDALEESQKQISALTSSIHCAEYPVHKRSDGRG